jgi:hypothetical protein
MQDAVDCPEWVVPFHLFKLLAEEVDLCIFSPYFQQVNFNILLISILPSFSVIYFFFLQICCRQLVMLWQIFFLQYDLELVLMKNFHEFVNEYLQKPEFADLMRRLGALGDGRSQSN